MGPHEEPSPRAIPAVAIIHQEGVIGVIALVGLSLRPEGMLGGLAPRGSLATGVFTGVVVGALCAAGLWALAEEALIRALLQPVIGLLPAALLFAVLHVVPDRRLWLWPVLACALGVGLGMIFEFGGYPAAAAAHIAINAFALLRLRRTSVE